MQQTSISNSQPPKNPSSTKDILASNGIDWLGFGTMLMSILFGAFFTLVIGWFFLDYQPEKVPKTEHLAVIQELINPVITSPLPKIPDFDGNISLDTSPLPASPIRSWRYAVEKTAPSVVNINVTSQPIDSSNRNFLFENILGQPVEKNQHLQGSGVVIGKNEIVTTQHILGTGNQNIDIRVEFIDGRTSKAKVIGVDKTTDLALLRLTSLEGTSPVISFGNSEEIHVGDPVAAIGNPHAVGQTVTQGIISATHRNIGNPFLGFLQTDAAINPGNSGGALVDIYGRLVGISSRIVTRADGFSGIGFAIPVDTVLNIIDQLRVFGNVRVGWLGIAYVSEVVISQSSQQDIRGISIRSLYPQSPLIEAGIQTGDIIVEIDGESATRKNMISRMTTLRPGDTVRVLFLRQGNLNAATLIAIENPQLQTQALDEGFFPSPS